ncbi:hypothetical protein [Paracoccus sp. MKU1]|uniref:hypothetical protein n=1 Tax=Paracoccus sp. MKU1 TaxID=1745182 RepID=UPI00071910A4|nr:hypothetical protein [Paracoccus sp. MKU1]KRW94310.1 hypothetical protein AQY21_20490 [Paracoccus sp. MKU1]
MEHNIELTFSRDNWIEAERQRDRHRQRNRAGDQTWFTGDDARFLISEEPDHVTVRGHFAPALLDISDASRPDRLVPVFLWLLADRVVYLKDGTVIKGQ